MKTFKDTEGRSWTARVDANALRRVRDGMDVNLGDVRTLDGFVQQMRVDDLFMVDLAFWVCKPQADERKLTQDQFCEALSGDAIGAAYGAVVEGLTDFFRDPELRKTLKAVTEAIEEMVTERFREAEAALTSSKPSTASPEPSGSIPVPSR